MASDRFLNLPAEKRQRIIDAAVDELSKVPFDEMSINRIIKEAGIPRGSFYEYFSSKEDLLKYIMHDYRSQVEAASAARMQECGGDVFRFILELYKDAVKFGLEDGKCQMFKNVFSCLKIDGTEAVAMVEIDQWEMAGRLLEYANTEKMRLKTRDELHNLFEMLLSLFREAIVRAFSNMETRELQEQKFAQKLKIIEYGAMQKGIN